MTRLSGELLHRSLLLGTSSKGEAMERQHGSLALTLVDTLWPEVRQITEACIYGPINSFTLTTTRLIPRKCG